MGRRRTKTIAIRDLKCYPQISEELQNHSEISEFEISEGIICLKGKKAPAFILDIDSAINNLKRYHLVNQHLIQTFGKYKIIRRGCLAKALGISRPTLNKWISNHFIIGLNLPGLPGEFFSLDDILEQLISYKEKNK